VEEEKEKKEKKEEHELIRVPELSAMPPDTKDIITPTDVLALMMLKDFIKDGFPYTDPLKQVDTAYRYAELMSERRKK
jgi:hypothetical protein